MLILIIAKNIEAFARGIRIYFGLVLLTSSNFGSTNVVSIVSYLLGVKNRMNYVLTTSNQLYIDFL